MDLTELAQTVMWLEDERQRDKAEIARLAQNLELLRNEIIEQAGKIKDLEARLANAHVQLARSAQIEVAIEKARHEISDLIQRHESRIQAAEHEMVASLQAERDVVAKAINDVRAEVTRYAKYEKVLDVQRIDIQRLNESLSILQGQVTEGLKDLDGRIRSLAFLEDLIRRVERNVAQLQTLDAELRQQQSLVTEAVQKSDIERQRQVKQLQDELKMLRAHVEQLGPRIAALQERQDENKSVITELRKFEERLRLEQDQVSERQRLAEDRQKRELGEWQAENEKRWKRLEVITEQQWAKQKAEHEALVARVTAIEHHVVQIVNQLDWLWQAQRQFAYHRVSEVQKWIEDFEKILEERERAESDGAGKPPPSDNRPVGSGVRPAPQGPTGRA